MISSYIPGRVRIRSKALKNAECMEQVVAVVNAQDGIKEVVSNIKTGSLLVLYDPEVIKEEQLQAAFEMLKGHLGVQSCKKKYPVISPASERQLLNASFALTLLGTFFSPRVHIIAGGLFTALAMHHMYTHGMFKAPKKCTPVEE